MTTNKFSAMSKINTTCASPTTAQTEKEGKNLFPTQSIQNHKPSKEEILFFLKNVFAGFLASEHVKLLTALERQEIAETYNSMILLNK